MMLEWKAVLILVASVAVMSWASVRLTTVLEGVGARLKFSEGLLGIVTALGVDSPEICSAFVALMSDQRDVGLGVVLGSNIFNLAGLLGLSALVAGRVEIGRQGLWLNGGTSLAVSAVLFGLIFGWLSAWLSLAALAFVLVPYVALTAMHPAQIARLKLPVAARRFLGVAVGHAHSVRHKRSDKRRSSWNLLLWLTVSLALVVGSSVGAVHTAVLLGDRWDISHGVIGMLVLAVLTSIPNVIAAVKLAREGRGAAVVSESLNSNTINIVAGICLPALVIGFAAPSRWIVLAALWLLGMKIVAIAAAGHRKGLRRSGGLVLMFMYLLFALAVIVWT